MKGSPQTREGGVQAVAREKAEQLDFGYVIEFDDLVSRLRNIQTRGIFDERGQPIRPYQDVDFSLVQVTTPNNGDVAEAPQVLDGDNTTRLWTPQPTIYEDQIYIMTVLDAFLEMHQGEITTTPEDIGLCGLTKAVGFTWPNKGKFHVMPPVIERHSYELDNGRIDLDNLREQFRGCYVKDAEGNLHSLSDHDLKKFYVDHQTNVEHLSIFNDTVSTLDYGRFSGTWEFDIICDGAHRIAYALEEQGKPTYAILVTPPEDGLIVPYYAVPKPFHPATRLTSKQAEKLFKMLENDKIHLLHDLIKKTGHYDWEDSGLYVSSLRSKETD